MAALLLVGAATTLFLLHPPVVANITINPGQPIRALGLVPLADQWQCPRLGVGPQRRRALHRLSAHLMRPHRPHQQHRPPRRHHLHAAALEP